MSWALACGTPCSLQSAILADGFEPQHRAAAPGRNPGQLDDATVDHDAHTIDGDRAFRDVSCQYDSPSARRSDGFGLLVERQIAVQRTHFHVVSGPLHQILLLTDLRCARQEHQDVTLVVRFQCRTDRALNFARQWPFIIRVRMVDVQGEALSWRVDVRALTEKLLYRLWVE